MKRIALYLGLATGLVASCSIQEETFETPRPDGVTFYASIEQPAEDGTRVYANEDLLLRWTADDRVSIFNKNSYNQQYRFTGETGDNAGGFDKVEGSEFTTGNVIAHVVAVYPYLGSTKISESEALTVTLPAEQYYAENTFGLGANTMVSVSSDTFLLFKNIGGYLRLNLYGKGVSVRSIELRGNKGEKLAGKATVTMSSDGVPSVVMADDASSVITLTCETPVTLGATADESTAFWFVVPPGTFRNGFTVSINQVSGSSEKSTSKSIAIERNKVTKMSPLGVERVQPNNIIFYTSTDGKVVTPNSAARFGANIVSNEYIDGRGAISFDGDVTMIGSDAFYQCSNLLTVSIPDSVTRIDGYSFAGCTGLADILIPESVTNIGSSAFNACKSLTAVEIPKNVSSIGAGAFAYCERLAFLVVDSGNPVYDSRGDCNAIIETSGNTLVSGCMNTIIPGSVVAIGHSAFAGHKSLTSVAMPDHLVQIAGYAFYECTGLTGMDIPADVTSVGAYSFYGCTGLSRITVLPDVPPAGGSQMLDETNRAPIYVPRGSLDTYKAASFWSSYKDRMQGFSPVGSSESGGNEGIGYDQY